MYTLYKTVDGQRTALGTYASFVDGAEALERDHELTEDAASYELIRE